MLSFVKNFFKGRDEDVVVEQTPVIAEAVSSSGVSYDPNLIDDLQSDHSEIVKLYSEMWGVRYDEENYPTLAICIGKFRRKFQAHLLKENIKFYVYLEQVMKDDEHSLNTIKSFRTDMNKIANFVVAFCNKYTRKDFSPALVESFEADYKKVGRVLTQRVTLEENDLYTLYSAAG